MVNEFAADAFRKATAIQSQAQQLVLTLPLANGRSQVRAWTPHFVTGQQTVSVMVDGISSETQRPGLEPRLPIAGSTWTPTVGANTTQQLVFVVPGDQFGATRPDAVTPLTAELTVPFRSPILHKDKTATYKLLLGLLPPSPGKIRFSRLVHTIVHEQRQLRTPVLHQQGHEDGTPPNNGHALDTYCTDDLEPGWRIAPFAPGQELFHLDRTAGDESSPGDSRNENVAWTKEYLNVGNSAKQCVQVWTKSFSNKIFCGWHSGDIEFHLERTVEGTRAVATWTTDKPLGLRWGESKVSTSLR